MERMEQYHMTKKEMIKLQVVEKLIGKSITLKEAALILELSSRQVLRLKKGVILNGALSVVHKNKARKPANAIDERLRQKIIGLKKSDDYQKANFSHFKELVEKHEEIIVSIQTMHRILKTAGLSSPRKHKKAKKYIRRARKPAEGIMAIFDASPYEWIEGITCNLHGAIDDATGKILGLRIEAQECLKGYFNVTEQMVKGSGIPLSTYSDRHTIFFSPKKDKLSIEEEIEGKTVALTQLGRAMDELGVKMIAAGSAQAKGKIEKLWDTLQDRIPVELKIAKISTIEAANNFLPMYLKDFNNVFATKPQREKSCFRATDGKTRLDYILCIKETRTLDSASGFKYRGCYWQLISGGKVASAIAKSKVTVLTSEKIGIKACYSERIYSVARLDMPQKINKQKSLAKKIYKVNQSKTHPWKIGKLSSAIMYDKTPQEVTDALFDSTLAWNPGRY